MVDQDPDAPKILARLKSEGIDFLYHFTRIENLPSISRHNALCSMEYLESIGEPCHYPGGNAISLQQDTINDTRNHTKLSLTPQTQMGYWRKREVHLCFFVISTEVAGLEDVIFTNSNSASGDYQSCTGLAGLDLINFEMVKIPYRAGDPFWHKYHQAEVHIPHQIPMEYVSKVAFLSEASLQVGEHKWGARPHPEFVVNILTFQDQPDPLNQTIEYQHISNVILTDEIVNSTNYHEMNEHKTTFSRTAHSRITAIVKLHARNGTTGKVVWSSNGAESEHGFSTTSHKTWWPHISLEAIPNGHNTMEIRLNETLWATCEYEVVP